MSDFICPVCGNNKWHRAYEIHSVYAKIPDGLTRSREEKVRINKCTTCDLEFNDKILNQDNFDKLYKEESSYTESGYSNYDLKSPKYSVDVVRMIDDKTQERGRLLEIGFLDGSLLRRFKSLGWSVEGVDLDPKAAENIEDEDISVYTGDIHDSTFDGKKYDAIIAIAVLEHILQPKRFIRRIRSIMGDDGIVLLQIPNPSSLNAKMSRLFNQAWDMYCEPGHLYHYKKNHLEELLIDCGFEVCTYETSTVRIRGKIPFLPGRKPYLETSITDLIKENAKARTVYFKILDVIDSLELGDTHITVARK